ncbi:hypothetical protein THASP1DRAFT_30285 [Thamnocephalis sphaerospora]|uniref:Uncharacterized protein n=1 Tax=Thamnocephalis sphaerospora TaxID=78915 RepID=A0A4P9XPH2_9FUNG|nr:hypothetical protein THASP1DRAFT_30285 [Thamnocephalis sphaerospora]|eukprot:RKP07907.1 hypothetical protein THASP1DRAFT_30285 [Thamnocephalis sphaerospora]
MRPDLHKQRASRRYQARKGAAVAKAEAGAETAAVQPRSRKGGRPTKPVRDSGPAMTILGELAAQPGELPPSDDEEDQLLATVTAGTTSGAGQHAGTESNAAAAAAAAANMAVQALEEAREAHSLGQLLAIIDKHERATDQSTYFQFKDERDWLTADETEDLGGQSSLLQVVYGDLETSLGRLSVWQHLGAEPFDNTLDTDEDEDSDSNASTGETESTAQPRCDASKGVFYSSCQSDHTEDMYEDVDMMRWTVPAIPQGAVANLADTLKRRKEKMATASAATLAPTTSSTEDHTVASNTTVTTGPGVRSAAFTTVATGSASLSAPVVQSSARGRGYGELPSTSSGKDGAIASGPFTPATGRGRGRGRGIPMARGRGRGRGAGSAKDMEAWLDDVLG